MTKKGHHFLRWKEGEAHHQLRYRVTPTFVTLLPPAGKKDFAATRHVLTFYFGERCPIAATVLSSYISVKRSLKIEANVVVPEWLYCMLPCGHFSNSTWLFLTLYFGGRVFQHPKTPRYSYGPGSLRNERRADGDGWMCLCVYVHHISRKKHRLTNGWLFCAMIAFYCVNLRSEAVEYSH